MLIYYIGKFTPAHRTECYVTHALEQHRVEVHQKQFAGGMNYKELTTDIKRKKPDVVLFSKSDAPCFSKLLVWCRDNQILTVAWMWDLFWGYRKTRPRQFQADLLFTTDGGHKEQWESIGANHHVLRQGIHQPDHVMLPTDETQKVYDVGFFGHNEGYRHSMIRLLEKTYRDKFVRYTDKRGVELNKAIAQCRVVVGDSYPANNYWSNRIYEMLGRGAFLVHPRVPGLEQEFTEGVHYAGFNRRHYTTTLTAIIEHYLNSPDERQQIQQAGFDHCGANYTYTHRVGVLLEHINNALESTRTMAQK